VSIEPSGLFFQKIKEKVNKKIYEIAAKVTEVILNAFIGNSADVIMSSYSNSQSAKKESDTYALNNGFYTVGTLGIKTLQTWGNEPDAYRHFMWNVLNVRQMGQNDAMLATNLHEKNYLKGEWLLHSKQNYLSTKKNNCFQFLKRYMAYAGLDFGKGATGYIAAFGLHFGGELILC